MFRRDGTRGRGRSLYFGDRLINLCLAHKQYLRLWLLRHRMKMTIGSSGGFGILFMSNMKYGIGGSSRS